MRLKFSDIAGSETSKGGCSSARSRGEDNSVKIKAINHTHFIAVPPLARPGADTFDQTQHCRHHAMSRYCPGLPSAGVQSFHFCFCPSHRKLVTMSLFFCKYKLYFLFFLYFAFFANSFFFFHLLVFETQNDKKKRHFSQKMQIIK